MPGAKFAQAWTAALKLPAATLKDRITVNTTSAHAFFRANPPLFHHDLETTFAEQASLLSRAAPKVTIAGDPHLFNFGTFRSQLRTVVWGLNDFDQAQKGPVEADLQRLAVSAVLMGRAVGLSEGKQKRLVKELAIAWASEIERASKGRSKSGAFLRETEARGDVKRLIRTTSEATRSKLLEKLTVDGKFKLNDDVKAVDARRYDQLTKAVRGYAESLPRDARVKRPVKIFDVAQKLHSGGSSYGLPRFYVLVEHAEEGKLSVVLELKVNPPKADLRPIDASDVVKAAARLGGLENPLTGSARLGEVSLLVRELEPEKARLTPRELQGFEPINLTANQAAVVLARAHAHTGNAVTLGKWVKGEDEKLGSSLAAFAAAYADNVEAGFKAYKTLVRR